VKRWDDDLNDSLNEYSEDIEPKHRIMLKSEDTALDDTEDDEEEGQLPNLDPELMEMFSEARIITKKSSKSKKKKEKVIYNCGERVSVKGKKGTIIYGPYEVDNKQMYEIDIDDNGVISAEEKHITKI
jgi:hypothetical protein